MNDLKKCVEEMIRKAASAEKADDALKFSQAASNAAHAMCDLCHADKDERERPK